MAISKILVANRGEIARRVFRTCREMEIATVAVYSDPDVGEPHALEADEAVRLPGATPGETYLNAKTVIDAAITTEADAIHPGYGFLSENADFARMVAEAGLTWIGPPPDAIEVMGSKIASKQLMSEADVPTLPSIELAGLSARKSAAMSIGYPILVKASAGGGGKGMRIVKDPDDLLNAIEAAKREAAGAFGDDTLFLEKYLQAARHIEIQVFADTHGNVVSLFERECSIQRRHQKIIEESPSVALDDRSRKEMGKTAIVAAKAVDYVGAGTVEFLFQDGSFFFLEMNTRLQVEHPVTEMVTGLDLVRLQIEVAQGSPLPPEALSPEMRGHAIEARLYAEDPLNEFLPVTGTMHRFAFSDQTDGLRVDSGIENGSEVSVHYDPMLAKVIASGSTRQEAIGRLATALRGAHIHGPKTNRDLLVRVVESEQFADGETDTHFLDRHDIEKLAAPLLNEEEERLAAIAAALADQAERRRLSNVLGTIPSGWRNSGSQPQRSSYTGPQGEHDIRYTMSGNLTAIDGQQDFDLISCTPHEVEFTVDEIHYHFEVARYGQIRFVDSDLGSTRLDLQSRFPKASTDEAVGSLHAPMPGKVIRVDVMEGDIVKAGQVLLVLEAMKMEHAIKAPLAGRITEINCRAGDQVEADLVLVVVSEE